VGQDGSRRQLEIVFKAKLDLLCAVIPHFLDDLYDTRNVSVLFDSGAFTFWNAGEPPQRASDLARICERAARWCDPRFREVWFITLDVMAGRAGPRSDIGGSQ
jgi:hypothetical protein